MSYRSSTISLSAAVAVDKPKPHLSSWGRLKQQQLSAWQPVYSMKGIFPLFLTFGIILIPLGAWIYVVSRNTHEIKIDYTNCLNPSGENCADVIRREGFQRRSCSCSIPFEIPEQFEGDVHLYYGLTKFYQNHRTYTDSRDDNQLLGDIGTSNSVNAPGDNCSPFDKDDDGKFIIPCGAVANSMFNDSIRILYHDSDSSHIEVNMFRTGIAWESDKKYRYKNPAQFANENDIIWNKFTKPKDWNRTIWDLDRENPNNNGLQNEDFIVWMRVSALPNFRKLYRRVDSKSIGQNDGLPKGQYTLEIVYDYEVASFGGTKSVIITEKKFLGGRNITLGIITLSSGIVIFMIGILFVFGSLNKKRSWSNHNRVSQSSIVLKDYGTHRKTTSIRQKEL